MHRSSLISQSSLESSSSCLSIRRSRLDADFILKIVQSTENSR